MIYKISNKYYVNISPMIFSEVELVVSGEEVIVKPVGKKIEVSVNTKVEQINLADEKAKILKNNKKPGDKQEEYRPNKYSRRK